MTNISTHIARKADRLSRRAVRQGLTGCLIFLIFPLTTLVPCFDTLLLPILILGSLFFSLTLQSLIEFMRLERLRKRYNSPLCPPIQL